MTRLTLAEEDAQKRAQSFSSRARGEIYAGAISDFLLDDLGRASGSKSTDRRETTACAQPFGSCFAIA